MMKKTTPHTLYELMQSNNNIVIIDVRNPDEYEKMHIPNAILLPLPEFSPQKTLEYLTGQGLNDSDIYITCASGKRAQAACQMFIEEDYPHTTLIEGGTLGWYEAGLPVEGSAV
jgi:rhodanese-related sulfurtransferase